MLNLPRVAIVALALLASGCAETHKLAACHGPLVALNPSHWQPTAADMAALDKLCPEDKS